MSEVHVNITTNKSGSQVVFHNPGQTPTSPNVGTPVVASGNPAAKTATIHGQIPGVGVNVLFHNPA